MKTIVKLLTVIIFSFISAALVSQTSQMPAPGKPEDFTVPKATTFKLDNGMSVTLVPFGNIPKATVSLIVRAGNLNEPENETWLADFTGNMLKEGTRTRTGRQIADEAASMGGSITVSAGVETTSVSGDVLSEFTPDMVRLIADVAMNPSFPDSETGRLRNDMLRDLSIQKSQPSNIAFELFSKVLFPGHPFGRLFPDEPVVKSFTAEKARDFYNSNFGAERSHLYVAGLFDMKKVEQAIRDTYSTWIKGEEPLINVPSRTKTHKIYFADRPGAPQSVIDIGLPVVDPTDSDYIPLILTNSLLGGSFTSRITMNIREDKGYTYSPYSRVLTRYRTGIWMQFAEVQTDVTVPSVKEIMYEIKRLTDEPVSEKELEGVKNYMSGIFVLSNSTRAGIISQLAFLDLHGLDISWLNSYISRIRAVTVQDVQDVMKKYFNPGEMTIVIAGDRKKVGKEIGQYGEGAEVK
ncbi:MAG TPA: pitrilysin family protein [Bacteroidales bacterium]|jgi:predicted Zn-dependent peptidase|nr:pitrilysin family protein [Bacteroidales bacterium]